MFQVCRPLRLVFAFAGVFGLALLLPFAFGGCLKEPEEPLRVGTFLRPGFEPFFLARSLGYYPASKIKLVEFPSSSDLVLAWRNRAIDAAAITSDDILRLAAEGQTFKVVMLLDQSAGADAVLLRKELPGIAALKGHKVAVESNALGGYLLARALKSADLHLSDVQMVSARIDRVERDLILKNVDAVVAYEPYVTRILARGSVRTAFDSSQLPGQIFGALIVPTPQAERPSAGLQELAAGWFRALHYLAEQPADTARRLASREGLTPAQFAQTLGAVKFTSREENGKWLHPDDATVAVPWKELAGGLAECGMLPGPLDPAGLRSDILFRDRQP